MRERRGWIALASGLGLSIGLATLYCGVYTHYKLEPITPVTMHDRNAIAQYLALAARGFVATQPRLEPRRLPGPIWASVYHQGKLLTRIRSDALVIDEAVAQLAIRLRRARALRTASLTILTAARLKIDICIGKAPVVASSPQVLANSVSPGIDGLGLETPRGIAYLLPDDMLHRGMLNAHQPFFFMPDLRMGLDVSRAMTALADQLELTLEAWRHMPKRLFRFRLQSFLKTPGGTDELLRFRAPVQHLTSSTVRQAAIRGADYLVRQLREDGSFHYDYYPLENRHGDNADYNLPRHAGTTWFLALAYRELGAERYRNAATRSIEFLVNHAVPPGCNAGLACVGSDDYATLGAAALTLAAIAEYQIATRDRRFDDLARRLGRFILAMQHPSGEFCHAYRPRTKQKECTRTFLYYSGEAVFGLSKLYQSTRTHSLVKPIERALDFLVGKNYNYFLGQFIISEDHWTCIAAEAAPVEARKASHLAFCRAFGDLNRRAQIRPDEPLGDLAGAFTLTPFFMPHNTPVGSRTEANISTYLLSQSWNQPDRTLLETIRLAVGYLISQQLRDDDAYLFPDAKTARGGIPQTPVRPYVRIDFVQHAASAMLRSIRLFEDSAP